MSGVAKEITIGFATNTSIRFRNRPDPMARFLTGIRIRPPRYFQIFDRPAALDRCLDWRSMANFARVFEIVKVSLKYEKLGEFSSMSITIST